MRTRPQKAPTGPPRSTITRDIDLTDAATGHGVAGAAQDIQATISVGGDLSGQVAVGSGIVQMQIGTMYGNVITTAPAGAAPAVSPRSRPVRLLPRAPSAFVGRTGETGRVIDALLANDAVSITGPPGVGKSTLLRFVAHHPRLNAKSAGVVHLSTSEETPDDFAQALFDAFYETTTPYKPSRGELRQRFRDLDAAVLLDDVTWSRDQTGRVLDTSPAAGFALASEQPVVAPEVRLGELPAAVARPAVAAELGAEERRALGALATVPGLALDDEQLTAAAAIGGPRPVLARLVEYGLVLQRNGRAGAFDRFAAAPGAEHALTDDELRSARGTLDEYFRAWALRHRHTVRVGPNEVDAAVTMMRDAARQGRWPVVVALGQAVESSLSLAGRWDAWGQTLDMLIQAAEQLGADDVRAFALHQRGTLAACTGDALAATGLLQEALWLREEIGDVAGAKVTRANLRTLAPAPPPPPPPSPPPPPRPTPWAWILLGTVAAIAAVVGGLLATGVLPVSGTSAGDLVSVPAVVGMAEGEAVAELERLGLTGSVTTVEDDLPPGTVVGQDPGAGAEVEAGSQVRLLVASQDVAPTAVVVVPGVVDEPVEDAVSILDDVGLSAAIVTVERSDIAPGTVVGQDPGAGAEVEAGSQVRLLVASQDVAPTAVVVVPGVVDEPVEDAVSILDDVGLSAAIVTVERSDIAPGTVVEQDPGAGAEVEPGSIVTLEVAQPPVLTVPSIVERSVDEAVRVLAAEGLQPGNAIETDEVVVTSEVFDAVFLATGTVIEQNPSPGTEVVAGTPVDMVVLSQDSVIVPRVEGLDLGKAASALAARNLGLGPESLLDDDPRCSVASQDPAAGAIVQIGDVVDLQTSDCPIQ